MNQNINPYALLKKLIASFDNSSEGFSARKLSSFAGVYYLQHLSSSLELNQRTQFGCVEFASLTLH